METDNLSNDYHNLQLSLHQEGEQDLTDNIEVSLSPVQIQQEYFENLPDCDWVRYRCKSIFIFSLFCFSETNSVFMFYDVL